MRPGRRGEGTTMVVTDVGEKEWCRRPLGRRQMECSQNHSDECWVLLRQKRMMEKVGWGSRELPVVIASADIGNEPDASECET